MKAMPTPRNENIADYYRRKLLASGALAAATVGAMAKSASIEPIGARSSGAIAQAVTGTGSVATAAQGNPRESASVFDFMTAAQIADVKARTALIDVTAAIKAAIGSGNKTVYFPSGTYLVSTIRVPTYTRLTGDGYGSIIKSDGSPNHIVVLAYVHHCTIDNLRIYGNSGNTNRCGIYADGAVWTVLENLLIDGCGSHGIQFTDTGTAYSGSYPVMCRNVHCYANSGDGYHQVATGSKNQQNAIFVSNCEFQGNAGNGMTLWGTHITVVNSVIEGNAGYGINFDNGLGSGIYSATSLVVSENYFELNAAGHIHFRVGTYGVIQECRVSDNYLGTNTSISGIRYKAITVTNYSSTINSIRNFTFQRNHDAISGVAPTVNADFDNALNASSVVIPYFGSLNAVDVTTVPAKYTNLGYATLKFVKNLVLNGYWFAKGGSGITYSNYTKSDSITVSESSTYFPIQIPLGSRLFFFAIPVETDCKGYTVSMQLRSRAYDSVAAPAVVAAASGTGSGSQLVRTLTIPAYSKTADFVASDRAELVLQLSVAWATPGTHFYLGSPSIYYVES